MKSLLTNEQKEQIEKTERARIALLDSESNSNLYMAWILVCDESKEYAERVLNTPLAD